MFTYLRVFCKRISTDFKRKELLPVKVLFFIQMSTVLVLNPYITIHMREIGINIEETAIMAAIIPVVGILMPPLAGILADKLGNFKAILSGLSVIGGLVSLTLLLVPVGRITVTYPRTLKIGIICNNEKPLELLLPQEYPCVFKNNGTNIQELDAVLQSCGFVCPLHAGTNDWEKILETTMYKTYIHNTKNNEVNSLIYNLTGNDVSVCTEISESHSHKILKDNDRYATAIRKFSENAYYFPSKGLYNLTCNDNGSSYMEYNSTNGKIVSWMNYGYQCVFAEKLEGFSASFKLGVKMNPLCESDKTENVRSYAVKYIQRDVERFRSLCGKGFGYENYETKIQVYNNLSEVLELENCLPQCISTVPRAQLCNNADTVIPISIQFTFLMYLGIRILLGIVGGTAYTMFEGAIIAILREYRADYGLQRMYASIGGMIATPLSGFMIDYVSKGKGYTDFRPVFYLYAVLKVLTGITIFFINLEFKKPARSVLTDTLKVMNIEMLSLFFASFLLGCSWGYIENFLFWLIQDLGGSKSLMGLTVTVAGFFSIPLLVCSGPLIKFIGHVNIIGVAFIGYGLRLLGYSLIYNPWYALIFGGLEFITHSLWFTASSTYASRLSTASTDTTIQGIFGGMFYGLGKSVGSLIGGYLIEYFGMRGTFQIFAVMSGASGILYASIYHIFLKKHSVLSSQKPSVIRRTIHVFQNPDLTTISNATQQNKNGINQIKSAPYEENLVNLGFEHTEFDDDLGRPVDIDLRNVRANALQRGEVY